MRLSSSDFQSHITDTRQQKMQSRKLTSDESSCLFINNCQHTNTQKKIQKVMDVQEKSEQNYW